MSREIFGAINIAEDGNNFFALQRDLSIEDEEFSGFYTTELCYLEIKKYDVVYYNFEKGAWAPSQANSLKTLPAKGIALTSALAHDSVDVLLYGELYNSEWNFSSNDIHKFIYLDQFTPGGLVTVDKIDYVYRYRQPLGLITSPNQIFFYFYQLWFNNIDEGFS